MVGWHVDLFAIMLVGYHADLLSCSLGRVGCLIYVACWAVIMPVGWQVGRHFELLPCSLVDMLICLICLVGMLICCHARCCHVGCLTYALVAAMMFGYHVSCHAGWLSYSTAASKKPN